MTAQVWLKVTRVSAYAGAFCLAMNVFQPAAHADAVELRVLSTRADMVSGGEAFVQFTTSGKTSAVKVTLDGREISKTFHPTGSPGVRMGLVEGLRPGLNVLEARAGDGTAKLEITNHAITGPIFSGPHQTPFACQTDSFQLPVTGGTLGKPLDEDCSAATRVDYVYKAADGKLKPLPDPASLPADVTQTKVKDGRTVNFIVRVETGTINRSIYQVAMLHDPTVDAPADPWRRPAGWNGRLIYNFGGGCNAGYHQGATMGAPVLTQEWLALGYAVATATFNTWANNCHQVLSPETAMMVREHFIDRHGPAVHTLGIGCSGGAMQIQLIAQNYPGLLDGIIPICTHPDMITYYQNNIGEVALLNRVFDNAGLKWTDDQKTAVSGFANWNPVATGWMMPSVGFGPSPGWAVPNIPGNRRVGCDESIPGELMYDPVKNPRGMRCDIYDNMVNIFGRDPKTGFARRPLDNTGVQYGLVPFNQGKITAEQFVVLNESIGGYDIDGRFVKDRMEADPEALRIAYATGQVLDGRNGLATTPILTVHTYAEATNFHARVDAFMTQARLIAANGDAANNVIVTLPGMNINTLPIDMLLKMDEWLDNLAKDPSPPSHAKAVRTKPADLVDACFTEDGRKIAEPATFDGPGECNRLYPNHGNPRMAAGLPVANDILKCVLKPVAAKDYAQPLNGSQITRLKTAFPQGVCDYNKPGVAQQIANATWLRFGQSEKTDNYKNASR